jgi:hypothetical protein
MLSKARIVITVLLASACAATAAEPTPLTQEQMVKAVRTDTISIPTPGELFAALSKPGAPNWSAQYAARSR